MGLMGLMGFMAASVLTGCLTSWVVILLKKWGVIEWVQVHGNAFFCKLVSCDYCLNFHCAWMLMLVVAVVTGEWFLMLVPFFSTTIGRLLSA